MSRLVVRGVVMVMPGSMVIWQVSDSTVTPASFGPKTGTPEQGVDDTFVLYAGPESGR